MPARSSGGEVVDSTRGSAADSADWYSGSSNSAIVVLLDDQVKELKKKLWQAGREKGMAVRNCEAELRRVKEAVKSGARDAAHALCRAGNDLEHARVEMVKSRKNVSYWRGLAYKQGKMIEVMEEEAAALKKAHKSEQVQRVALEGRNRRADVALEKETKCKENAVIDNRKRAAEGVEIKKEKKKLAATLAEAVSATARSEAAAGQASQQVAELQEQLAETRAHAQVLDKKNESRTRRPCWRTTSWASFWRRRTSSRRWSSKR